MPDEPSAPQDDALRARVAEILAAYHGKETAITEAGKENMRTVNRLGRLVRMRHAGTERTFRQNVSRYHGEDGHCRPPVEAMIKRGQNEHRHKSETRDGLDDLLARLLFGSWPRMHPPLQELRVFFHEV